MSKTLEQEIHNNNFKRCLDGSGEDYTTYCSGINKITYNDKLNRITMRYEEKCSCMYLNGEEEG